MAEVFEFAKKKITIKFPNGNYEVAVDGLLKAQADRTAEWMRAESYRLSEYTEDISLEEADKIIRETDKIIMDKIDELLGKGAISDILGERINAPTIVLHSDICDVMGFILGCITKAWDELLTSRRKRI